MPILRIQALLLLFLLQTMPVMAASVTTKLGEELEYTLNFRGILTGFVKLDIAKLTLSVAPEMAQVEGNQAYATRMQMTTEPYAKAEMIYPLRLDYRSWLDAQRLQPLVASKALQTRESKQELFWFDRPAGTGYHYQTPVKNKPETTESPPDHLRQFATMDDPAWSDLLQTKRIELNGQEILDYMGLLHQLRQKNLTPGEWYEFSVFSGKKIQHYRVEVGKERLKRGGWDLPAYRLKLYEYDTKKDRLKDEVNIWLSDDGQRRMLRFYAERTVGALEGLLETGRPENGRHDDLSESTQRSLEAYLGF
ncbi:MAG: DUF3108 domain-containing protein [Candidatus Thiodiazotropha sp. (ex Monitilora ramsayi)]|nr:DUF3108 domain-containing protein [Candidatus Thiodiazotropha sp. (ex Monitilora ramsayi)]